MKASDIPDSLILEFLYPQQGSWTMLWDDNTFSCWINLDDKEVRKYVDIVPAGTPNKVLRAKMRSLVRRDLIGGCDCGCRGDFEITDKGLALIGKPRIKPYTGY